MDVEAVLRRIDELFDEKRAPEAEDLLMNALAAAVDEGDEISLLKLLNELMGVCRETSQWEKGFQAAQDAMETAERVVPVSSIPYATTLLNAATLYRAAGRLEESSELYDRVQAIYEEILKPEDPLMASLLNNRSLLFQEMGKPDLALTCLERALTLSIQRENKYEEAVTRTNIAGTKVMMGDVEGAEKEARQALAMFAEQGVRDQHTCAAQSALGSCLYIKGEFAAAMDVYREAMDLMEITLGRNGYYERLKENYEACAAAACPKGLDICRGYYEQYGAPMIAEHFPEYAGRIAVGLVGEGSDAFGLDDAYSRDHDWGPSFCMFVTEETYGEIGEALQNAYEELPISFGGFTRAPEAQGAGRRGVIVIGDFYERLLQARKYEDIAWENVSDASLAAAVNGEIWRDEEGIFTAFREKLLQGYPSPVLFAKLAESCGRFGQDGQYNLLRLIRRKDHQTASQCLHDALRTARKIHLYAEGRYPIHDKWLRKEMERTEVGSALERLLTTTWKEGMEILSAEEISAQNENLLLLRMNHIGDALARELYAGDYISDVDPNLTNQIEELLGKSIDSRKTTEELAMDIAKIEFAAFDRVVNEGGRADCQNNWPVFSIMRRSQYLTWNRTMLLQYLYDFRREISLGHNLITEKYGRMMASTAPERYEELKEHFPELSPEKIAIIEQIAGIQVGWMEDFASRYPGLAQKARRIRTEQDSPYDTSYETYLRGELGTYSDKMLELYARFIVDLAGKGANLAEMTMRESARLYGYADLDAAEAASAR